MNKPAPIRSALVIAFIISSLSFAFAAKTNLSDRTIELAGLVVNAQDLSPVDAAKIYDGDNNLLGSTDKNGYYDIKFIYTKSGEIYFKLKIVKKGYHDLVHNEHWGNLGDTRNVMYFGLKRSGVSDDAFSSFADNRTNITDLSYNNVLSHFDKVRKEKVFNDKLKSAKNGNENVLIQIDGAYYIVDSTGWIKLDSDKDLILINDKQIISADKLNTTFKRKNVKWMSTVDSKQAKFAIHTK